MSKEEEERPDDYDEEYDPGAGPPSSLGSIGSPHLGAGLSMSSLPDINDLSISRITLQVPREFAVSYDRDMRDVPAGKYGFESGNAYGSEARDPRDAAAFDIDSSSVRDDFYRDSRAVSELQDRQPTQFEGDEELHTIPESAVHVPKTEDDGSDPHSVHLWGRMPRKYRTIIVMFVTFLVLLLLIIGILFPIGGSTEAETRVYYIAAERVRWDYLPSEADLMFGENGPISDIGKFYTSPGTNRIGHSYLKAQYRRYTNANFSTPYEDAEDAISGILGPTIYCQVGDTIVIHFRNNLPFTTSIHAQGVDYDKESEAYVYGERGSEADSSSPSAVVQPGETRTYTWEIGEMSGPEMNDGLSVAYLYYPGQDAEADWNAGLIGLIVVTRAEGTKPDGSPAQTAHNFPLLFATFDENLSPFLEETAEENLGVQWNPQLKSDPEFQESNRMASINGYAFCNLPVLTIEQGTYVQWYLASMSNGLPDIYVSCFHGNTAVVDSHRTDAVDVNPGIVVVAEMRPPAAGLWLIRSATQDLYDRGVTALYNVTKPPR